MHPFLNRLSTRIALLTVGFLGLLAAVTALLLHAGFRDLERTATSQSIMSLEQQGQDTVRTLVVREAELTAQDFRRCKNLRVPIPIPYFVKKWLK